MYTFECAVPVCVGIGELMRVREEWAASQAIPGTKYWKNISAFRE
jgi:hypothetical protein